MLVRAKARGHGEHGLTPMWLRAAAVAMLATAAPAAAQTLGMPGTGGCHRYQSEFPALAGLTEAEAVAALERMTDIRTVRIAGPGSPMTRDYRPERATILLRDGRVDRIICG